MKTKKYYIENEFCDNEMIFKMEISKKEFDRQLKFLRNSVIVSQQMGYETPVTEPEWSGRKVDHTTCTETIYTFMSGCCATYLTAFETKEGYAFKTKKETKQ